MGGKLRHSMVLIEGGELQFAELIRKEGKTQIDDSMKLTDSPRGSVVPLVVSNYRLSLTADSREFIIVSQFYHFRERKFQLNKAYHDLNDKTQKVSLIILKRFKQSKDWLFVCVSTYLYPL